MKDTEVEAIASEPTPAKREREYLVDRVGKLEEGYGILRDVLGSSSL